MNLIRNNEITQNLINDLKIIFHNNTLEIINYSKILSFNDENIVLRKITIIGKQLKIIYIDKYSIRVNGKIHLVKGDIIDE